MSRVRVSPFPDGWKDEGPQEHVSRSARYTIGGSMVTAQPWGQPIAIPSQGDAERNRRRREERAAS